MDRQTDRRFKFRKGIRIKDKNKLDMTYSEMWHHLLRLDGRYAIFRCEKLQIKAWKSRDTLSTYSKFIILTLKLKTFLENQVPGMLFNQVYAFFVSNENISDSSYFGCFPYFYEILFVKFFFWHCPIWLFHLLNEPRLGSGIDPGMGLAPFTYKFG